MKRIAGTLLLLFLFCWPVLAQQPTPPVVPTYKLVGPITITEHELAVFTFTPNPPDPTGVVAWLVQPSTSQFTSAQSLVLTGKPGSYQVIAFSMAGGQASILQQTLTITPDAPAPIPNPPAPPAPTPTPAPVPVGPFSALGIFDVSTELSWPASEAAIYGSTTIAASLKSTGYGWYALDIGGQVTTLSGAQAVSSTAWGKAAVSVGLPAVVVIDGGGNIVSTTALPASEAALVASLPARAKK